MDITDRAYTHKYLQIRLQNICVTYKIVNYLDQSKFRDKSHIIKIKENNSFECTLDFFFF